jgi:hypothetical protein
MEFLIAIAFMMSALGVDPDESKREPINVNQPDQKPKTDWCDVACNITIWVLVVVLNVALICGGIAAVVALVRYLR